MGKGQCRGFRLKGKGQVMCVEVMAALAGMVHV